MRYILSAITDPVKMSQHPVPVVETIRKTWGEFPTDKLGEEVGFLSMMHEGEHKDVFSGTLSIMILFVYRE